MKKVEFYRHTLGEPELDSVSQTLDSLFLTCGPRVREFEDAFADYLGVNRVVGVNSCSNGLMLTLAALDIGPGDEVVTTPMTFVSTSNAALHLGADVVFADIDPETGFLDPDRVEAAITSRTRAVIVVHLYGQLVDMERFRSIADEHDVALIEDAAHAVEGRRDGYRPGGRGDAAVFSFYATKPLTSGDGGAIATNDEDLARRVKLLRNHGMTKDAAERHGTTYQHWDMAALGYKGALTDLQAALLMPQLDRLEDQRARREARVIRYEELLDGLPEIDLVPRRGTSAHHLFTVRVPHDARDHVLTELGKRQIGCAVNYRAVHTLRYYRRELGFRRGDLPIAESFGDRTISLPLWPDLPESDIRYVSDCLRAILRG